MDVQETKMVKRQIEINLREVIQRELTKFEMATGLSASHVSVNLASISVVGTQDIRYVVDTVGISVSL